MLAALACALAVSGVKGAEPDIAPATPASCVELTGFGEIFGYQPAVVMLFEPPRASQPAVNLLQLNIESRAGDKAFHLRLPFLGESLPAVVEVPGRVRGGDGLQRRVELGVLKDGRMYLAHEAHVTLELDDNSLTGTIDEAIMRPVTGTAAPELQVTGRFVALIDVTCWTLAFAEDGRGPVGDSEPRHRLDEAGTSSYCRGARFTQGANGDDR